MGDAPEPDVVEEFRLVTNQDAENGGDLGTTVQLVTKSGTNQYHGTVWEYLRNNALDSRNFLAKTVAPDKENEFGAAAGGPIIKDKHFFFASYDGYRRTAATGGLLKTVPTARMRQGDFSEWLGPQIGTDILGRPEYQFEIYDPSTTRPDGQGGFIRDPFNYNGQLNAIDPSRLSSISSFFQKYYPLPNRLGVLNNYVASVAPIPSPRDDITVKIDNNLGSHRITNYYEHLKSDQTGTINALSGTGWLPAQIDQKSIQTIRGWEYRISDTWSIRPNLLWSFNAAIVRRVYQGTNFPESRTIGQQAGLKGTLDPSTPQVNPGQVSGFGYYARQSSGTNTTLPGRMDLSWIKGKHELKFGTEYSLIAPVALVSAYTPGQFNFGNGETAQFAGSSAVLNTGNGYASYLLGEVASSMEQSPFFFKHTDTSHSLYAQDRWRVTPKLTVNYGLRWDLFLTAHESYDRMSAFDPTIPNPAAGGLAGALTFWGNGPGRNSRHQLVDPVYKNFGPRLGVAYQLDSRTVARAYYGIQYFPLNFMAFQGYTIPNYGWGATLAPSTLNGGLAPAPIDPHYNWNNGFPLSLPTFPRLNPSLQNGTSVPYVDTKADKVGMGQNIGFGLERRFRGDISVKADYVGNLIHDVYTDQLVGLNQMNLKYLSLGSLLNLNINSGPAVAAGIPIPYPGFNGTVAQALRPFPQFNDIPEMNAMTSSTLYHSLQLTMRKSFSQGLHFMVTYTIAKTITSDASSGFGSGTGAADIPASSLRYLGKAVSYVADRPQIFNLSWVYELPFGPGKPFLSSTNPFVKQLVAGWQISAIQNYGAGLPVRILGSRGIPTAGPALAIRNPGVPIRTNVGCGNYDPYDPSRNRYLNISAFSDPDPFALGNTRVLSDVRACGYLNESASIRKNFPIHENVKLEFGADLFNMFNRHYWLDSNLAASLTSPTTFGTYNAASNPRNIQFHLKIRF